MPPIPQIRFCRAPSGARVAYAISGQGPALLVPAAWISHVELLWQDQAFRDFFAPLAEMRTLVRYDRPGSGLSEPWPGRQTFDTELQVMQAVADHLELERLDLFGISMGAPASLAFAAANPDRVTRLVVYGGFADGSQISSPEVRTAMIAMIRAHWGLGSDVLADIFLADATAEIKSHFSRVQREAAPAQLAAELLAQCYQTRVHHLLSRVVAPTLVLHRRDDRAIPYRLGRELAAGIPGARLVSLPGRSHFPYAGDSAPVIRAILEFLGEPAAAPARPGRPPGPLTARQLQVAALVADGLTNRQIAQRLGIEERSAEGHLERIRQRLGVTSRAQVAAWWATEAANGEVPV
jgi:pimeloyl-ACP methyl ester carboxylesterase/DNA-binding CsgD family transcriptional regulator